MNISNFEALVQQVTEESIENAQNLFEVRHLNQINAESTWITTNNLLGNRYLCRNGALLFAAPTGIGKSSYILQAAIQWALGRAHFGIHPQGRLKNLIIQAENDDGDLADMRDGIFRGLELDQAERDEVCGNIQIVTVFDRTGSDFIEAVRGLVSEHRPDLIIIDPLFAYLGDSATEQKAVSAFLRTGLNPVLKEFACGLILVHHTNKPPQGREKPDWQAGEFAYLGSGSAELANWARAIIGIRSIGSHDVFEVVLGKRGKRAGLVDTGGNPIFSFCIKHGKNGIFWESAEPQDIAQHRHVPTADDLLSLIPIDGDITQAILWRDAEKKGISDKRTRQFVKELLDEKKIHEWKTKRSGTNPAKSYARFPQPQPMLI